MIGEYFSAILIRAKLAENAALPVFPNDDRPFTPAIKGHFGRDFECLNITITSIITSHTYKYIYIYIYKRPEGKYIYKKLRGGGGASGVTQ